MISSGQLFSPAHMSVLHVEQEVAGRGRHDCPGRRAVLSSDTVRESLLARERDLQARLLGFSPEMQAGGCHPDFLRRLENEINRNRVYCSL